MRVPVFSLVFILVLFITAAEGLCGRRDDILSYDVAEEYIAESVEILKENPVNLNNASYAMLSSIPGFPDWLAKRVLEVFRRCKDDEGEWINSLTPQERSLLYGFSDYIILPDRNPVKLYSRTTLNREGSGECRDVREYLSIRERGKCLLWRGRIKDDVKISALYSNLDLNRGRVRVHGGDFLPDFAMGLLFGARSFYYPFTSNFPVLGYRWILGRTSFYGESLRGVATELILDRLRSAIFVGRPRVYKGYRFEMGEERISGTRLEFKGHNTSLGCTAVYFDDWKKYFIGVDGRWIFDHMVLGWELISRDSRGVAGVWGITAKGGSTEVGFLIHAIPSQLESSYMSVAGTVGLGGSYKRGVIFVVKKKLPLRTSMHTSVECSSGGDGLESENRISLRAEISKRTSWGRIRLTWLSNSEEVYNSIPFPVWDSRDNYSRERLKLVMNTSWYHFLRIRMGAHYSRDYNSEGFLYYGSMRFRTDSGGCDLTIFSYRSLKGKEYFYFYEPPIKGEFPWKMCSGDGMRGVLSAMVELLSMSIRGKISVEKGKVPSVALQIECGLSI